MTFAIDRATYNKAIRYPQRHGYQLRGTTPSAIVIHSTSNRNKHTSFESEAKFLFESADVSAHYLVGKDGRIVEFLAPTQWQAWHAGECLPAFANPRSIGIELHISVGEIPQQQQYAALAWLVRGLVAQFGIGEQQIDTHRAIALPKGRKSDPAGWGDSDFYAWRWSLFNLTPPAPPTETRRAGHYGAMVREDYRATGAACAYLPPGSELVLDTFAQGGYRHLASGLGFVAEGDVI